MVKKIETKGKSETSAIDGFEIKERKKEACEKEEHVADV